VDKIDPNKRVALRSKLKPEIDCSTLSFGEFSNIAQGKDKEFKDLTLEDLKQYDVKQSQLDQIRKLDKNDPNLTTAFYNIFQGIRIEI